MSRVVVIEKNKDGKIRDMTQKEHDCSDCPAWSGTDCTNNPYRDGCLKDPNNDEWLHSPENPEHR